MRSSRQFDNMARVQTKQANTQGHKYTLQPHKICELLQQLLLLRDNLKTF